MVQPRRIDLPERRSFTRQNCRLHGVQGKGPLLITCLANTIQVFATHYIIHAKAPVGCPGFPECHWCCKNWQVCPKGFICARQYPLNYLFVAEITEGAARKIMSHPSYTEGLRGQVILLKRKGDKPNSPVYPEFQNRLRSEDLPAEWDIMPQLLHAYQGGLRKVLKKELDDRAALKEGREIAHDNGHSREENQDPSAALPVHGDPRAVVLGLTAGVGRELPR